MTFDPTILQTASVLGFLLVFLGGVLTSLGPCNVATIPLIMGFVGGSQAMLQRRSFALSLAFAVGQAVTFMLLGVIAALVGSILGVITPWWYYFAAAVCFIVGLHLLGILSLSLPMWFGSLRQRVTLKGVPGALGLGLVSGLVASQCATPVLAAILTYVMLKGALTYGAALLFVYALGRGAPVVLAGTFAGALHGMLALGRWSHVIEHAAGVFILGVGFYFLWIA